ncbi:aquaporin [Mergibacter septicus]|uniref:Aquaporin n=1 Tax=Mergibacter septicus TaxID=221402 RepID=A0A8E3MHI9_9PAST|nr:MIP/aquaporin family protein [Mergibacter septicus]AWX16003.1 aquaporin [Mergibacter septicus]QDJ12478.1 aquaporin [Mergibacter septicus]QDJ15256.1 aquaporin [Mergibacter septicus]UTU47327.1 aquaporin [Mergibacter septicus]WMR95495.1 MIP/aquaporin family protein [Mergibacter septicus]
MALERSLKGQCIAEALGTGLFIFFGCGCVAAAKVAGAQFGLWEISIVWGIGVALAIYLTAGVSGAHLNPAVTIALWKYSTFERKKVLPYILSQFTGAFCGAALVYLLYRNIWLDYESAHQIVRGTTESLYTASIFSTYPNPHLGLLSAFIVEFTITAILMCLVLGLTDDGNGLPKGPLAPLLIGFLIAVIGGSMGPLTGFAMNPARDFAPKLFASFNGWGTFAFSGGELIPYCLIPIIAPILGALVGAWGYQKLIGVHLKPNTHHQ